MDEKGFELQEKEIGEREVVLGLATTPEEKIGRLQVVTDRYIKEGYLQGIPFAKLNLSAGEILSDGGLDILEKELGEEVFDKFLEEGLLLRFKGNEELYLDKYH